MKDAKALPDLDYCESLLADSDFYVLLGYVLEFNLEFDLNESFLKMKREDVESYKKRLNDLIINLKSRKLEVTDLMSNQDRDFEGELAYLENSK